MFIVAQQSLHMWRVGRKEVERPGEGDEFCVEEGLGGVEGD